MPQSYAQVYLHLVWATKGRRRFLTDVELRERLYAYLAAACQRLEFPALTVGVEDHVHLLCRLQRTKSIAMLVRDLKRASSRWVKAASAKLKAFDWQDGYAAFSLSPAHVAALTTYIRDQAEHHRQESFEDEFRRLMKKYGLEIDEQHMWE